MMKTPRLMLMIALFLGGLTFGAQANSFVQYTMPALSLKLGYPDESFFGSSEEEISDLETYTSKEDTYYKEINNFLRFFPAPYEWFGIGPDDALSMVKNIDAIISRSPSLPSDLILFRGVDLNYRKDRSFSEGEEFVEKGYASTTLSFKVAKHFAVEMNKLPKSKRGIFLFYSNQAGLKGVLFDFGEDEVLLAHGEKFKVMKVDKKNPSFDLYLTQICAKVCESELNADAKTYWLNFLSNGII